MYEIIDDLKGIEKYSFSKLSMYNNCPLSYKFNYIDKLQQYNNGFSDLGSFVHGILERYLKDEILQFEMVDIFNQEFDEKVPYGIKMKLPNFTKNLSENYKKQSVEYLENFTKFDGLKIINAEEEFLLLLKIKDKKIFLHGFIDVLAKDSDDNYYVVDFKSKSKFKDENEIKEYARQLYMYCLYINYKYGKFPKELWFEQFRLSHTEKIQFDKILLKETLDWIYNTIVNIESEQFWMPMDFSNCKTQKEKDESTFFCRNLCGVSRFCKYWEEEI